MAPPVSLVEPTAVIAGSTWTWKHASAEFPVSEGWVLSYVIAGASKLPWQSSYDTNDGTTHTVLIPASATGITGGRYEFTRCWTGAGAYAGQVYRVALAPLTVTVNPATVAAGDRVAFAEANLAAVEAAITARLAGDQPVEYAIGGRSVRKMELQELLRLRGALQAEVRRLQGKRSTREIRFTVPSA